MNILEINDIIREINSDLCIANESGYNNGLYLILISDGFDVRVKFFDNYIDIDDELSYNDMVAHIKNQINVIIKSFNSYEK